MVICTLGDAHYFCLSSLLFPTNFVDTGNVGYKSILYVWQRSMLAGALQHEIIKTCLAEKGGAAGLDGNPKCQAC